MMVQATELPIETVREGTTAMQMAEAIFGPGVSVLSASYSGDIDSAGIYSNGDTDAPGATPGDSGIILSTGNAEDFTNSTGEANQRNSTSTNTTGENNNADFNAAAGGVRTFDASYIDIDFRPTGDTLAMEFVFSSEEYPQFINSVYQDFVAVWINGVQIDMAVGNGDIDPGNVNQNNSQNLFVDNTNDAVNSEMDGLTLTLSLTIPVVPGMTNSIRIGVADVGDNRYDSSLLIASDSLQTMLVAIEDDFNLYPNGVKTVDVLGNDHQDSLGTLTITHINGIAVNAGDSVLLTTGQTVTVNSNGTLTLTGDGTPEDFNFTYGMTDGVSSDTGIVNVSSIPCFVAGTLMETAQGPRTVESLQPGDLVMTKDNGPQPLRWIGQRTVAALGALAPIEVRANTFGRHGRIVVSPQHRILIRDAFAELLFGEPEVLVAAKHLINDQSVRRRHGGYVTYVHLMFDQHEVLFSEGLPTESFLPGPETHSVFEEAALAEICAIFADIDPLTGSGYSPAARRTLRGHEAALLSDPRKVA